MNKLSELFSIEYGNSLELVHLKQHGSGINFISRTSKTNGVAAKVLPILEIEPYPKGLITVAVSGNVLETFLQPTPFYTAFHVMVLSPKIEMTTEQKLFYCTCIRANKFKYSYGRQANSTLKDLLVPSFTDLPKWINKFSLKEYQKNLLHGFSFHANQKINKSKGHLVPLDTLFYVINGIASSEVVRYSNKATELYIPYIRPSYRQETSIDAFVSKNEIDDQCIFPSETLYVSTDGQGSHSYSYVSVSEFVPNSNVSVLIPKKPMTLSEKLFYSHCISINRYKFSYGRKPKGDRLKTIMLPNAVPDFITDASIQKIIGNWNHES